MYIYPPELVGTDDEELFWENYKDDNRLIWSAVQKIQKFGSSDDAITAKKKYMIFLNTTGVSKKEAQNDIMETLETVRYKWVVYLNSFGCHIVSTDQLELR